MYILGEIYIYIVDIHSSIYIIFKTNNLQNQKLTFPAAVPPHVPPDDGASATAACLSHQLPPAAAVAVAAGDLNALEPDRPPAVPLPPLPGPPALVNHGAEEDGM